MGEFPGLLEGCLPPSAHLLLSQIFSSFLFPPHSPASSWYASPVCWPEIWGATGLLLVLWGVVECEDGGTDLRTNPDLGFPSEFYRGTEEREGGFGT